MKTHGKATLCWCQGSLREGALSFPSLQLCSPHCQGAHQATCSLHFAGVPRAQKLTPQVLDCDSLGCSHQGAPHDWTPQTIPHLPLPAPPLPGTVSESRVTLDSVGSHFQWDFGKREKKKKHPSESSARWSLISYYTVRV